MARLPGKARAECLVSVRSGGVTRLPSSPHSSFRPRFSARRALSGGLPETRARLPSFLHALVPVGDHRPFLGLELLEGRPAEAAEARVDRLSPGAGELGERRLVEVAEPVGARQAVLE